MLSIYRDQLGEISMQLVDLMDCETDEEKQKRAKLGQERYVDIT